MSLVLQPDGAAGKDSCIAGGAPDNNYGDWTDFTVNFSGSGGNFGLIEFDISALPVGAVINSATLEVLEHLNCGSDENAIELHLNSAAWDEATVTWNNAPAYGASIGTNSGETGGCNQLVFDVTGAVQDWASGTSTNYGFRVTGPAGVTVQKYIYSSEWGTAAERPILRINYALAGVNVPTLSEWGMILLSMLIAISAFTILWRRRAAVREV